MELRMRQVEGVGADGPQARLAQKTTWRTIVSRGLRLRCDDENKSGGRIYLMELHVRHVEHRC